MTATATREFVCPECKAKGITRTFARAQALGAHRQRVHGVVGTSNRARQIREAAEAAAAAAARKPRKARKSTAAARRKSPRAVRKSTAASNGVNREALLHELFPNGLPPRVDVITGAMEWLDRAEELAHS